MTDRTDNFIASLGIEAYRVGGSVRDELLGRKPKDADYMVRGVSLYTLSNLLRARGIKNITDLTDRRGQTVGLRAGGMEIALPRREENAGSGRAQVIVTDPNITLAEDAHRRDFTFNALYRIVDGLPAEDPLTNVIDPTGRGLHDLQRGLIQTTHPDSFRDDPLRTLRALRFVARGFTLSSETWRQMALHANKVDGLSAGGFASGTVLDEMSKILMGEDVADALRIARDTGVLGTLFPELAPMLGFDQGSRYHDLTTDEHTFRALETAANTDAPLRVRWALLFHDSGKPATAWTGDDGLLHYYASDQQQVLTGHGVERNVDHEVMGERIWREAAKRIGAPKALREDVAYLIRHHMVGLEGKFKASKVRLARVRHGDDMLRDLYLHRACDLSGKGTPNKAHVERIMRMESERRRAAGDGVPSTVADLQVNGLDAQSFGLKGQEIGFELRQILHFVASNPTEQTMSREWQMGRLEVAAHDG